MALPIVVTIVIKVLAKNEEKERKREIRVQFQVLILAGTNPMKTCIFVSNITSPLKLRGRTNLKLNFNKTTFINHLRCLNTI